MMKTPADECWCSVIPGAASTFMELLWSHLMIPGVDNNKPTSLVVSQYSVELSPGRGSRRAYVLTMEIIYDLGHIT